MSEAVNAHLEASQQIFKNGKLSPEEINVLLGIKVTLNEEAVLREQLETNRTSLLLLQIAIITLCIAAGATIATMYQLKVGPFYETDGIAATIKRY